MMQDTVDRPTHSVELTDAAVAKVTALLAHEEPGLALQISVQPGGCSGLRYQLFFSDKYTKALSRSPREQAGEGFAEADDPEATAQRAALAADMMSVVWFGRVAVIIDPISGPYLDKSRIDYVDTLQKSGFVIDNPAASGSCACGDSFK